MPDNRQKLIHLHSDSVKVPTASQLEYGEIAIQYDATAPVLYIKNSSGQIVKFIDEVAVKALLTNVYTYKGSKATYEELPSTGNVTGDVWNVVAAHGNIPAGTNYAWDGNQWDSLGGSVDLSTYITNDTFTEHTSNTDVHVTTTEKNTWSGKQDAISDLETIRNNASSGKNAYDTVEANKDNWGAAYTVSQNALVGIETGKESGAAVSQNKKLDFSGLVINCGEY